MRWVARRAALVTVCCALVVTIGPATVQARGDGPGAAAIRVTPDRQAALVTGHAAAVTAGQQAGVRRYWTRARMRRTQRLRGVVNGALWGGGGAVARTTGKVFFTMGGHDYVCSGSTVASANSAVVVTAGHCVKNGTGAWATNWTFVPGYLNGNDPYGSYTANQFYVASEWSSEASNDYDVAFVKLNPARVEGTQVNAVQEVGGQGIEFGAEPARVTAFGYPADPPYNGQRLYYCSGTVHPDPYHETYDTGLACAMTEGSSGGPWLAGFGRAAGTGTIVSVSSFKYSTNHRILYGTPFGAVAEQLYQAAQSG